ncbi:GNAT family N-acetyltransferase [Acidipropionibacterium virtanenii]|uniref:N-acetyltransferase Eis n=1 Tax=Acidipropionibacterium virtanenii TaxID=2057246 RepID=A0A344USX3_9ACTN|nr:GNAT family N-acetyltransferase [Acidipropionibacterium virtanenii]AXE38371.1 N-acetyltransferase Eis [Acidipropionibacterium virtanenii]
MSEIQESPQLPQPYRLTRVVSDGRLTDELANVSRAVNLGFHMAEPDHDFLVHYADHVAGERLWAVRGPEPELELPGLPVATLASYDSTVNTGHGHLEPADFITDVTVRPTHRRRGILRGLISHDLAVARESGRSMAVLTATEGAIYGRFGFGVSSHDQRVEVISDGRFTLAHEPEGSVQMVAADEIDDVRREVFDAFHRSHRGSHGRLDWWVEFAAGRWDYEDQKPNRRVRSAVHRDADGRPDGVVSYEVTESFGSTLKVRDMEAVTTEAELALWEFLASIDLVTRITASKVNPSTPLPWAVRDPRVVRFTGNADLTWLRILDVARALAVRGWDHTGSVTLRVIDPLEWCSGAYRVDVAEAGSPAEVTPVRDRDAVALDIASLGSLYFGTVRAEALAGARRLRGTPDQVRTVARLFATDDTPHNITEF